MYALHPSAERRRFHRSVVPCLRHVSSRQLAACRISNIPPTCNPVARGRRPRGPRSTTSRTTSSTSSPSPPARLTSSRTSTLCAHRLAGRQHRRLCASAVGPPKLRLRRLTIVSLAPDRRSTTPAFLRPQSRSMARRCGDESSTSTNVYHIFLIYVSETGGDDRNIIQRQ